MATNDTTNQKNAKSAKKGAGEKGSAPKVKTPEITKESVVEFFRKYIRVLKLARTPTKSEFLKISAVAAIGIALIGVLGFVIYLLFEYLLP